MKSLIYVSFFFKFEFSYILIVLGFLLLDTTKRGTLSKNRKYCLSLAKIKAKGQPQGLGRFSDSPEAHAARPRQILRFTRGPRHKASDELPTLCLARDPSPEAPPERPRARYRFFVSLEAGLASAPPQLWPTTLTGHHTQPMRPTTPQRQPHSGVVQRSGRRDRSHIGAMQSGTGRGRGYQPLYPALCPRLTPMRHCAT